MFAFKKKTEMLKHFLSMVCSRNVITNTLYKKINQEWDQVEFYGVLKPPPSENRQNSQESKLCYSI